MNRFLSFMLVGALCAPSAAAAQNFAVGGHLGTLGIGAGAVVGLSPKVNLRGTLGLIPTEPRFTVDEVDFTVDFPAFTRLTVDFYPTGLFYLSAGGLFVTDGGAINVLGEFTGTQEFNGTQYDASQVGDLTGVFGLSSAMPYLGLGFGNPIGGGVSLGLELGIGVGDVPTVELGATGALGNDPTFSADLAAREAEFAEDIPELMQYYPVLALSLSFGLGG